MLKSSQRKVNKNCSEIIFYIIYLPPIDVLLLEGFPVKLGPGTQVIEPGHHFLRCPARHRFTDQRVMLVDHTTAPVIHQHHHLETHTVIKTQWSDHLFTLLILHQGQVLQVCMVARIPHKPVWCQPGVSPLDSVTVSCMNQPLPVEATVCVWINPAAVYKNKHVMRTRSLLNKEQ